MKKTIATTVTVIMLAFITAASFAQEAQEETTMQDPAPNWVSTKGYWVIKSNIKAPTEQTVFYYNNNHVLVYEQTVSGTVLNIKRKKVKMQLKRTLETSVTAWNKKEKDSKDNLATNK